MRLIGVAEVEHNAAQSAASFVDARQCLGKPVALDHPRAARHAVRNWRCSVREPTENSRTTLDARDPRSAVRPACASMRSCAGVDPTRAFRARERSGTAAVAAMIDLDERLPPDSASSPGNLPPQGDRAIGIGGTGRSMNGRKPPDGTMPNTRLSGKHALKRRVAGPATSRPPFEHDVHDRMRQRLGTSAAEIPFDGPVVLDERGARSGDDR